MKKLLTTLFAVIVSLQSYGQSSSTVSRDWTSFAQTIEVESDSSRRFKVTAFIKVESEDENATAGIWARVDNKPDQGRGFFDNMRDRPIKSSEWKSYEVQGIINSKSEKIVFGGICNANGKFFFDRFEIALEGENGEFIPVRISNHGFEETVEGNKIPGWNLGTSASEQVIVKEYTISTVDDSAEGKYALLLEGKGVLDADGSMEETFPNLGSAISIVYLVVLLMIFLTYHSSTDNQKWSAMSRIAFRFSTIYFILFILFKNNGAYPFFGFIFNKPNEWMSSFSQWFGNSILGIPYQIDVGPNGSGDTTHSYLMLFIIFGFAVAGCLIWSLIDRKRPNYRKLYYWITTAVRYYVGLMLINYGLIKVIQLQFSAPSFYRLLQPYGESSPMGLAWTFLGFSEGYNLFMGVAEVLAGLLLFRRTTTAGAVITTMTAMNVMAVNYFYDVPVKILSTHLVLMTLFLLARDLRKIVLFLFTKVPVENITRIARPLLKKWMQVGLLVFKVLIIAYAFGYGLYNVNQMKARYYPIEAETAVFGIYEVSECLVNGDTLTNYKDDRLWRNIIFDKRNSARVRNMELKFSNYTYDLDSANNKVTLIPRGQNLTQLDLFYEKSGDDLDFRYILDNDTITGSSRRIDKERFLLTSRGFHWVNERPYNR